MKMWKARNIGILIFDDVEVLDFCGPFEVFSVTGYQREEKPFNVFTMPIRLPPKTSSLSYDAACIAR